MSQLAEFYNHGTEVAMTKIASYTSYKKNVRGLEHADYLVKKTAKSAFAGGGNLGLIRGRFDVGKLRHAREYVNTYPKEIERHRGAIMENVEQLKALKKRKPTAIASQYAALERAIKSSKKYHEQRVDEVARDHKVAKRVLQKNIGSKKGFSSSLFKKLVKAIH